MSLSLVKAQFFRRLVLRENPHLNFPSRQQLGNVLSLRMAKRNKEKFIFPTFGLCNRWMS